MVHRLSIFLSILLLLVGCSSPANPQATEKVVGNSVAVSPSEAYTNISVTELQDMLKNKDFLLVNVHTPFDGNIPGTDLSIPYDQVSQNLDKLPDKNARIVLYCRSGRMSAMAADTLVSQGYTNIINLSGGMSAWEQAGLQIDR